MSRRILLVDPDDDARSAFSEAVKEAGYQIFTARNGAEAVHIARRDSPDLIVMGLRMPLADGPFALRYLRADSRTRGILVWGVGETGTDAENPRDFDEIIPPHPSPEKLVRLIGDYLRIHPLMSQPD